MLKMAVFFELAIFQLLICCIGSLVKIYSPTVITGIFNCSQLKSLLVGHADNG